VIGAEVHHPLFGRGAVLELRSAGRDAAVRFESGIRTVTPMSMLTVATPDSGAAPTKPPTAPRLSPAESRTPTDSKAMGARRTIEALR
jgi:hypothetical protein